MQSKERRRWAAAWFGSRSRESLNQSSRESGCARTLKLGALSVGRSLEIVVETIDLAGGRNRCSGQVTRAWITSCVRLCLKRSDGQEEKTKPPFCRQRDSVKSQLSTFNRNFKRSVELRQCPADGDGSKRSKDRRERCVVSADSPSMNGTCRQRQRGRSAWCDARRGGGHWGWS